MSDEYVNRITRELNRQGIGTYWFEHRRKHRAVVVHHNGEHVVFFPASGSDSRRGPANCIRDLRRVIGLAAIPTAKASGPRKKKFAAARAHRVPSATDTPVANRDKFYGPLEALKARLLAGSEPARATLAMI